MNNRRMLDFALLCALFGSLLCGDWQAIGNDQCGSFNNTTFLIADNSINTSVYEEDCESVSNQCFWNPQSHITREFCNICIPACLSEQRVLNFYQFGLGALLISFSASLGFVFLSVVISDISPVESQVL